MNKPSTAEVLASLKEMRQACAACFRVIDYHGLAIEAEDELYHANVKPGFGVRAQELIARIEEENRREDKDAQQSG